MIRKLCSILIGNYSYSLRQIGGARNDGLADQVGCLLGNVREDCKLAFTLHELRDPFFVVRTDHNVTLPVTNLSACSNRCETLGSGSSPNDQAAKLPTTGDTITFPLPAAQMLPSYATACPVNEDILINRILANRQQDLILLRNQLQIEPLNEQGLRPLINLKGITTRFGFSLTKNISLQKSKTSKYKVMQNFLTDFRLVSIHYPDSRTEIMSCFHN